MSLQGTPYRTDNPPPPGNPTNQGHLPTSVAAARHPPPQPPHPQQPQQSSPVPQTPSLHYLYSGLPPSQPQPQYRAAQPTAPRPPAPPHPTHPPATHNPPIPQRQSYIVPSHGAPGPPQQQPQHARSSSFSTPTASPTVPGPPMHGQVMGPPSLPNHLGPNIPPMRRSSGPIQQSYPGYPPSTPPTVALPPQSPPANVQQRAPSGPGQAPPPSSTLPPSLVNDALTSFLNPLQSEVEQLWGRTIGQMRGFFDKIHQDYSAALTAERTRANNLEQRVTAMSLERNLMQDSVDRLQSENAALREDMKKILDELGRTRSQVADMEARKNIVEARLAVAQDVQARQTERNVSLPTAEEVYTNVGNQIFNQLEQKLVGSLKAAAEEKAKREMLGTRYADMIKTASLINAVRQFGARPSTNQQTSQHEPRSPTAPTRPPAAPSAPLPTPPTPPHQHHHLPPSQPPSRRATPHRPPSLDLSSDDDPHVSHLPIDVSESPATSKRYILPDTPPSTSTTFTPSATNTLRPLSWMPGALKRQRSENDGAQPEGQRDSVRPRLSTSDGQNQSRQSTPSQSLPPLSSTPLVRRPTDPAPVSSPSAPPSAVVHSYRLGSTGTLDWNSNATSVGLPTPSPDLRLHQRTVPTASGSPPGGPASRPYEQDRRSTEPAQRSQSPAPRAAYPPPEPSPRNPPQSLHHSRPPSQHLPPTDRRSSTPASRPPSRLLRDGLDVVMQSPTAMSPRQAASREAEPLVKRSSSADEAGRQLLLSSYGSRSERAEESTPSLERRDEGRRADAEPGYQRVKRELQDHIRLGLSHEPPAREAHRRTPEPEEGEIDESPVPPARASTSSRSTPLPAQRSETPSTSAPRSSFTQEPRTVPSASTSNPPSRPLPSNAPTFGRTPSTGSTFAPASFQPKPSPPVASTAKPAIDLALPTPRSHLPPFSSAQGSRTPTIPPQPTTATVPPPPISAAPPPPPPPISAAPAAVGAPPRSTNVHSRTSSVSEPISQGGSAVTVKREQVDPVPSSKQSQPSTSSATTSTAPTKETSKASSASTSTSGPPTIAPPRKSSLSGLSASVVVTPYGATASGSSQSSLSASAPSTASTSARTSVPGTSSFSSKPPRPSTWSMSKPPPQQDGSKDSEKPKQKPQLGLKHLPLLFSDISGGKMQCRSCVTRRKESGKSGMPVQVFDKNAAFDVLRDHCLQEHPEACEQLLRLSSAKIVEIKQRMAMNRFA